MQEESTKIDGGEKWRRKREARGQGTKLKRQSDSQIERHGHARFTPISYLLPPTSYLLPPTTFLLPPTVSHG